MSEVLSERVWLLRAYPHAWGSGFVHQIDVERDQTLCGRTPKNCPGEKFSGSQDAITCKGCLRSIEAKAKHAELMVQIAQAEVEAEIDREAWWQEYDAYLNSPAWKNKRRLVLQRAGDICEGCGATCRTMQVHHLRYPRDCRPGSPEWIAREKLFELRAVCPRCHEDIHA